MWPKFLEGVGNELAQRWIAAMLAPSFIFWAVGLAAWAWRGAAGPVSWSWQSGWSPLVAQFRQLSLLPTPAQLALLIGGLLLVATSAIVVQPVALPVLRLLEGYWPRWLVPLRRLLVRQQIDRINRDRRQLGALAAKGLPNLSPEEQDDYAQLDRRLMRVPAATNLYMPTRLGNILRAAESHSQDKYGLNAAICWPRLWLVLPDGVKTELTNARAGLDTEARVVFWSALVLVWSVWAWWAAPLGLLAAFLAYRRSLSQAEIFGDLLEAAFDVQRIALYQALRWPLPENPAVERQMGQELTGYLWRGSDRRLPTFVTASDSSCSAPAPADGVIAPTVTKIAE